MAPAPRRTGKGVAQKAVPQKVDRRRKAKANDAPRHAAQTDADDDSDSVPIRPTKRARTTESSGVATITKTRNKKVIATKEFQEEEAPKGYLTNGAWWENKPRVNSGSSSARSSAPSSTVRIVSPFPERQLIN